MKCAYFEDGTVIECKRRCDLKRAVKIACKYDVGRVWFRICYKYCQAVSAVYHNK